MRQSPLVTVMQAVGLSPSVTEAMSISANIRVEDLHLNRQGENIRVNDMRLAEGENYTTVCMCRKSSIAVSVQPPVCRHSGASKIKT
jgi:hypothetical protein